MFKRNQYEKVCVEFFTRRRDLWNRYQSDDLIDAVVDGMVDTLPTQIAAEITFNRLVAEDEIQRTDGKTSADDAAAMAEAAKRNFDRVVAEVEAPPLSREELETFYSMSPRERAEHYWAGDGYNSFRVRFDKAIKEHGFEQPARTWGPGA